MQNFDEVEKMSLRARAVVNRFTLGWSLRGRYEKLEEMTKVSRTKWQTFMSGKNGVTPELLAGIAKLSPETAAFLLLGPDIPAKNSYVFVPELVSQAEDLQSERDDW